MKLYLVRHAAAIERITDSPDAHRYLTPEGRVFFRKTARTLLKNSIEPGIILTSPFLRALQTADILAEALDYNGPLVVREELQPGFDMQSLHNILNEYKTVDEIVLVGHEPDLSSIISRILPKSHAGSLKKGATVKLKINPSDLSLPADFRWLAIGKKLVRDINDAFAQK
jgi:phosphohistidine phosphatase